MCSLLLLVVVVVYKSCNVNLTILTILKYTVWWLSVHSQYCAIVTTNSRTSPSSAFRQPCTQEANTVFFPSLSPWQTPLCDLFLCICHSGYFHVNQIMQYRTFMSGFFHLTESFKAPLCCSEYQYSIPFYG